VKRVEKAAFTTVGTKEFDMQFLTFNIFWLLAVAVTLLAGKSWKRARIFREKMMYQWKAALIVAVIYLVAFLLGTGFNPGMFLTELIGMIGVFCMSLLGTTFARSLGSFEPFPVTQSFIQRKRIWSHVAWSVGVALLAVPVAIILGIIGTTIGSSIFHETIHANNGSSLFPMSKWMAFFQLLAGAGIFEETFFRLLILTFVWWVTGRRWLAILLSAVAFGAYHLSPLDSFYLTFWQHPMTEFLSKAFVGILLGFIYIWRGYETAVLSHTLSDWLPFVLFT
jgi:membrane protease YdiL (CAAX protease family)